MTHQTLVSQASRSFPLLEGTVLLVREVRVHPDRSNKDSYILSHWVQEEGQELKEVSQEGYVEWLKALQWLGGSPSSPSLMFVTTCHHPFRHSLQSMAEPKSQEGRISLKARNNSVEESSCNHPFLFLYI